MLDRVTMAILITYKPVNYYTFKEYTIARGRDNSNIINILLRKVYFRILKHSLVLRIVLVEIGLFAVHRYDR